MEFFITRFKVWAKHGMWRKGLKSLMAFRIFAPLSVTTAITLLSEIFHWFKTDFKCVARFAAVCSSSIWLVLRTREISWNPNAKIMRTILNMIQFAACNIIWNNLKLNFNILCKLWSDRICLFKRKEFFKKILYYLFQILNNLFKILNNLFKIVIKIS